MSLGGKLEIDVTERSVPREGQPQALDERLFMHLQVFTGAADEKSLVAAVQGAGFPAVLYRDLADPRGVGLLTLSTDPAHFVTAVRGLVNRPPFAALRHRPEMAMVGRTYATGYEPDLRDWLLDKPRRNVLNPELPWAVWYPLRRTGAFAVLPAEEQRGILAEHARIGIAYGQQGLAHDIRLACHGLDTHDNEFVIGVVGRELHPLSHLIQTMRKTRQTSEFIQAMGPFFVGHVLWRSPAD